MHKEVKEYFDSVKAAYPFYFSNAKVLDCGSLDINGNNRYLFTDCDYIGIDIVEGKNVDIVTKVHEFLNGLISVYDVVISSEMLEHDKHWKESLQNMFRLVKPNGLLLFTAAGTGREEHGTTRTKPKDSPLTNDYYLNVTKQMVSEALVLKNFTKFELIEKDTDIRFYGIKK